MQNLGLAKRCELSHLLEKEHFSMYAMVETFHQSDHDIIFENIHPQYKWLGKARKSTVKKTGGGLGLLISKSIEVLDNKIFDSKNDEFERLWIKVKAGQNIFMVGVTYFPNDGIDKDNSSFLMTELIENISQLQSKGHHCILLGDFNGKIGEYRVEGKASFNGDLLEKLIETADMKVLNKSPLCTGKYTWHRGSTKTTIDYALISSSLENNIDSVIIDEVGDYDLGSDHNTICVSFNSSECKNNAPLVKNTMKWKINEVKDWSAFRLALSAKFANFECDLSQPINQTWLGWKQIVTEVGEQYVGKKEIKDDKKHVCDKETKKLIQNRRTANRFYRYWAGKETCDPEILQELWQEFLRRKRDVHEKIKTIKVQNKIKVISLNSRKGTKNTRSYWRMLKRLNGNNGHPLKICDPNDKSKIINDPKRISEILGTYWKNLGNSGSPTGDKDLNNTLMEHLSCDGDKVDMSGLTDIVIDENTTWNAISKLWSYLLIIRP